MADCILVNICAYLVRRALEVHGSVLLIRLGCRFILPLLGEYVDSGYRTPKSRIVYSLRSNGRFQLIVLACSAVGLGYVLWQTGFAKTSAKALVMAYVL